MGNIVDQIEGAGADAPVRCPICDRENRPMDYCRHVRWTFDQGDPLDFARFALETSPYTHARRHRVADIPKIWWDEHGDWVVDRVLVHFDARDGYVFGDLAHLDLLARDIWKDLFPEPERPALSRF